MGLSPTYPATLYRPPAPVDLSARTTRERLSPPALRGFLRVMDRWQVRDEDARALLGGVSNGTWYAMKRNPDRLLDADQLVRISYVLGIFQALEEVHSPRIAAQWMALPNANRLFAGQAPLEYLLKGGLPAMHLVRQLLDARRAGV